MQPHEPPRRDRKAEERQRQRGMTVWLSAIIVILVAAITALAIYQRT